MVQTDSKTGVRGVCLHRGRYRATVIHNGKQVHAGYFNTLDEAERAVIAKRQELFTHSEMDRALEMLQQPDENWIGCAVCLNQKAKRVKADVIVNGLSVCADHVDLAGRPNFDIQTLRTDKGPT